MPLVASGCWSDDYSLGLLAADLTMDLTQPSSWKKSPEPVFEKDTAGQVHGLVTIVFLDRLTEQKPGLFTTLTRLRDRCAVRTDHYGCKNLHGQKPDILFLATLSM